MRGFAGRGGLGRLAAGQFGQLADGTVVVGNSSGMAVPAVPAGSQAANAVPNNAGGALVQGKGLWFEYQVPIVASLAAGASASRTIQFDQNSSFNWLRTTYTVNISGDAEEQSLLILPEVTLQITDQGNGMSFMNAPVPIYALAGTGSLPYVLPTPQLIQPNASFIYQFANFSAGSTYINLYVQFHGYRIFNSGQA
jgi:hypothetical protein